MGNTVEESEVGEHTKADCTQWYLCWDCVVGNHSYCQDAQDTAKMMCDCAHRENSDLSLPFDQEDNYDMLQRIMELTKQHGARPFLIINAAVFGQDSPGNLQPIEMNTYDTAKKDYPPIIGLKAKDRPGPLSWTSCPSCQGKHEPPDCQRSPGQGKVCDDCHGYHGDPDCGGKSPSPRPVESLTSVEAIGKSYGNPRAIVRYRYGLKKRPYLEKAYAQGEKSVVRLTADRTVMKTTSFPMRIDEYRESVGRLEEQQYPRERRVHSTGGEVLVQRDCQGCVDGNHRTWSGNAGGLGHYCLCGCHFLFTGGDHIRIQSRKDMWVSFSGHEGVVCFGKDCEVGPHLDHIDPDPLHILSESVRADAGIPHGVLVQVHLAGMTGSRGGYTHYVFQPDIVVHKAQRLDPETGNYCQTIPDRIGNPTFICYTCGRWSALESDHLGHECRRAEMKIKIECKSPATDQLKSKRMMLEEVEVMTRRHMTCKAEECGAYALVATGFCQAHLPQHYMERELENHVADVAALQEAPSVSSGSLCARARCDRPKALGEELCHVHDIEAHEDKRFVNLCLDAVKTTPKTCHDTCNIYKIMRFGNDGHESDCPEFGIS